MSPDKTIQTCLKLWSAVRNTIPENMLLKKIYISYISLKKKNKKNEKKNNKKKRRPRTILGK